MLLPALCFFSLMMSYVIAYTIFCCFVVYGLLLYGCLSTLGASGTDVVNCFHFDLLVFLLLVCIDSAMGIHVVVGET